MPTTIGVEEEFVLLDPATLTPVERAEDARDELGRRRDRPGTVTGEFFLSQIEYASPVCTTTAEALDSLREFRSDLAGWAAGAGLQAAGVGMPYRVLSDAHVTGGERYRDIASHFGLIVPDHQINGLHVHVGVDSRERAIRALNRLRPWLPSLLALSANSPFWQAADTGFDSWRAIHSRRWTTYGVPPPFHDAADYDRRISALHGVGGTSDAGTLNWVVRPSARYPTVEVRVFDAQLDAVSSVALAALVRGLVVTEPRTEPPLADPELLDSALWHAARNGLSGELLQPCTGRLQPAAVVVATLLDEAARGLAEHGDTELVESTVDRILSTGNGATRQRQAFARGGVAALSELTGELGGQTDTVRRRRTRP
ncbi:YbdK family carboxylate-amine ligase [Leifsonia sp. NPDC058230]|uniref:carboxylate-amine ligase n=1 Tax=Leifsonia sp. NPDC058230 TaxID=3346391 RepID=UPI0036DBBFCD